MSSAKQPQGKEPPSLQTTRQMLDELDALMGRMLALPVNDLEEAPPPPREIVRMPTVSASLTMLEAPESEAVAEEETPQENKPLLQESFPAYTSKLGLEKSAKPAPTHAHPKPAYAERKPVYSEPKPDPIPEEEIPPSLVKLPVLISPREPALTQSRFPGRSLGSLCLLPFLWFNQAFDTGTRLLGPPGRWLRGSAGRQLLGFIGLALLGAAGLWCVKDWLGWTW